MKTTCERRWQPGFERWHQRCVVQPKKMEVKLKILGGGTRESREKKECYKHLYHDRSVDNI
jgi:hypothetical protein